MTIYYTVNTAFIPYLDTFREEIEVPSLEVNQNWTTQEQVLPIHYNQLLLIINCLKHQEH